MTKTTNQETHTHTNINKIQMNFLRSQSLSLAGIEGSSFAHETQRELSFAYHSDRIDAIHTTRDVINNGRGFELRAGGKHTLNTMWQFVFYLINLVFEVLKNIQDLK